MLNEVSKPFRILYGSGVLGAPVVMATDSEWILETCRENGTGLLDVTDGKIGYSVGGFGLWMGTLLVREKGDGSDGCEEIWTGKSRPVTEMSELLELLKMEPEPSPAVVGETDETLETGPKQVFHINSMGECHRGDEYLDYNCEARKACSRFLNPARRQRYAKLCAEFEVALAQPQSPERGDRLAAVMSQMRELEGPAIAAWFKDWAETTLTPEERAVYAKHEELSALTDSRFRVYGGINETAGVRTPWIHFVTEFCEFTDRADFWTELDDAAAGLGASVEEMVTQPHLDHYSPPKGTPGERAAPRPSGDRFESDWAYGPDHGRQERQVELRWELPADVSLADATALRDKAWARLEKLFNEHGVGVL